MDWQGLAEDQIASVILHQRTTRHEIERRRHAVEHLHAVDRDQPAVRVPVDNAAGGYHQSSRVDYPFGIAQPFTDNGDLSRTEHANRTSIMCNRRICRRYHLLPRHPSSFKGGRELPRDLFDSRFQVSREPIVRERRPPVTKMARVRGRGIQLKI